MNKTSKTLKAQFTVALTKEESLQSRVFSKVCENSFQLLAIVTELALDAGFTSLDAVYESAPQIVEDYCDTAHAALRGLKKLEERHKYIGKLLH